MKNAFFYFILFPFFGLINAIRHYRSSWAKPTMIAFVAFFGLSMVKSDTADSTRYVQNLEMMYNSNKDFETIQNGFYSGEGGQADVYVTLVTFIFSLFTDNGNLLFMFPVELGARFRIVSTVCVFPRMHLHSTCGKSGRTFPEIPVVPQEKTMIESRSLS